MFVLKEVGGLELWWKLGVGVCGAEDATKFDSKEVAEKAKSFYKLDNYVIMEK